VGYFSWVLGVGFAVSFSIINAMWLEQKERDIGERAGAAGEVGHAGAASASPAQRTSLLDLKCN